MKMKKKNSKYTRKPQVTRVSMSDYGTMSVAVIAVYLKRVGK